MQIPQYNTQSSSDNLPCYQTIIAAYQRSDASTAVHNATHRAVLIIFRVIRQLSQHISAHLTILTKLFTVYEYDSVNAVQQE